MQKYSILLTLASVASAGCCTVYSETNMQGDSHQLCYDSSKNNPDRDYKYSRYDLSKINLNFKGQPKSISCDSDYSNTTGWWGWYPNDQETVDYFDDAVNHGNQDFGWTAGDVIRGQSKVEGFGWVSYGDNKDLYKLPSYNDENTDLQQIIIYDAGKGGSTVTVYAGENCTNNAMSYKQPLRGDDISLDVAIYQNQGMTIKDDDYNWTVNIDQNYKIYSIRVPAGLAVNLYNSQSASPYQTIYGQDDTCFKLPDGHTAWDEGTILTSMSIYSSSHSVNFATGRWIEMSSSSQGQTVKYHLGLTSTKKTDTTAQMSASITDSMSAGIKFGPEEAKESVSMTVSESIKLEVDKSKTYSTSTDYSYPCNPPKDGEDAKYGASLYQWQVDNGTVTSMDNIFICRTGKDTWNSPPNCPPSACVEAICQTCHEWRA